MNITTIILLVLIASALILSSDLFFKSSSANPHFSIVTGSAYPGRVFIYNSAGGSFARTELDTGYNLVYTVRIGDIFNNGENEIVAGVGNSFFAEPHGCKVIYFVHKEG